MKSHLHTPFAIRHLPPLILAACLAFPLPSLAGPVTLATAPLANATTSSVLPNLMFILDNSGSMGWDYLPDWANGNYCKDVPTTTGATFDCYPTNNMGLPPFTSSDYNRIYYDPAITYAVPWDASLATPANKTSYAGSGNTPKDGYGIQSVSTTALTTSYPDVEFCTDNTWADCLRNDNYVLPGMVNNKNYTVIHMEWCTNTAYTSCVANVNNIRPNSTYDTPHNLATASGTKSLATGTVAAPTTVTRTLGPFYYVMIPGEYCTDQGMTSCITATAPDAAHPFPAKVRWCNSTALTTCKATQDLTQTPAYQYPRYPTIVTTAAVAAGVSSGQITATNMPQSAQIGGRARPTIIIPASCSAACIAADQVKADCNAQAAAAKTVVTSIKLINASHPAPGTELLTESFTYCNGNGTSSTRRNGLAAAIQSKIGNGFVASLPGSSNVVAITTPDGTYNGAALPGTATWTSITLGITTAFAGGATAVDPVVVPGSFQRVDIVAGQTYGNIVVGGTTVVNRTTRTDCTAAPNCTYAEELSNFANWYAWYRTRMQMMKTSASRAFKTIDNKYRVGFYTINDTANQYLKINTFNSGAGNQKALWYTKLFAANPGSSTPLRSTLTEVGRIFAGKNPLGVSPSDDPMQYSCQQNFALLTTDGYWNTDVAADIKTVSGGTMGNLDGGATPRPMYEGPSASSGSLADVAKYYYDTDLRTSALGNCTGPLGLDVCENNVFVSSTDNNVQQHMTTFTLGLGVDGTLVYQSDYKTATSGDYYKLKNGLSTTVGGVTTAVNWPVPVADTATAVDDLWHAAVNGQGSYFSAKNPAELASGLNDALAAIGAKIGSGAAAATSTLNPVAGDNSAYVASYTTVRWTGNLEARSINIDTGVVSEAATWCVENTVAGTCTAPGAVAAETSGASTIYNCVTPGATAGTCASPGVLVGTECKVELPVACTGTMAAKVGAASDSRTIYTNGGGGSLVPFVYANLNPADFNAAKLAALSQWPLLTAAQQTAATGANLVNYLRGQNGYEDRASNPVNDRLYRYRDAVLGDAVESQPAYIAKPTFSYSDPGYSTFKTAQAGRAGTVYMGANDGMMHAFNSANGQERWAYVPSMVIPNLWKLADKNYSTMHTYYANGSSIIADICTANCSLASATWRTILVAGLNGGGRGYYALDITSPTAPTLLWEYTTASQPNLGYSFGQPVVTKKADGTWVVLVTSGYNNTSPGDGQEYLYVLNAQTGTLLNTLSTGVGGSGGLGKLAAWADYAETDNTAGYVYGGDLAGNLWRFDINKASGAAGAVVLFATLKDAAGAAQPITTRPELGKIEGKRVVFVGTGKYLETADLTDIQQQTLYAIKDADDYPTATPTATLVNPRLTLVQQTLTTAGAIRTDTANTVDFKTGRGWYLNFPDSGERSNVDSQLVLGTLLVPTTVPSNTVCSPGGYGWLNFFNYKTGSKAPGNTTSNPDAVSQKTNAPIVGINTFYLPSGDVVTSVVTSDHPTPDKIPGVGFDSSSGRFVGKRVIWRELIQ